MIPKIYVFLIIKIIQISQLNLPSDLPVEKVMFDSDSPIIEQPNIDVADWLETL